MSSHQFKVFTLILFLSGFMSGCASKMSGQLLTDNKPIHSMDELVTSLHNADYIILGENHDNAIHHDLQLTILQELHSKGWLKQISMEMLTPIQQAGADSLVAKGETDPDQIYKQLQWNAGWDWALYGPIVIWAVSEGVPLKAANLSKDELKIIRSQPVRIGEVVLGKEGLNIHRERLRSAHCGHIDKAMEEKMLRVQVARDARMANSLMSVRSGGASVVWKLACTKGCGGAQVPEITQA